MTFRRSTAAPPRVAHQNSTAPPPPLAVTGEASGPRSVAVRLPRQSVFRVSCVRFVVVYYFCISDFFLFAFVRCVSLIFSFREKFFTVLFRCCVYTVVGFRTRVWYECSCSAKALLQIATLKTSKTMVFGSGNKFRIKRYIAFTWDYTFIPFRVIKFSPIIIVVICTPCTPLTINNIIYRTFWNEAYLLVFGLCRTLKKKNNCTVQIVSI